jgi:hypothetical protein
MAGIDESKFKDNEAKQEYKSKWDLAAKITRIDESKSNEK